MIFAMFEVLPDPRKEEGSEGGISRRKFLEVFGKAVVGGVALGSLPTENLFAKESGGKTGELAKNSSPNK